MEDIILKAVMVGAVVVLSACAGGAGYILTHNQYVAKVQTLETVCRSVNVAEALRVTK